MQSFFSSEIRQLNSLYNRIQFSFVFLYGRYGTGKSTLVRDFCREKHSLFFSARETVPSRQLFIFWQETIRFLKPSKKPEPFTSWNEAFSYISDSSFSRRLILVLDEFQNLALHDPDFMNAFSSAINHAFPVGKLFLIITSSSVEYAELLMSPQGPEAFRALTAKAHLNFASFYACKPRLTGYSPREQLLLYGVTGGLPACLELLNLNHPAEKNIPALFFDRNAPLLHEPLTQLHRDLREISTYNFLLEILAFGKTRLADIASDASMGTNKCAKYLNTLISLGIVRKEFPAAGEIRKKVRYVFADHMLRFWYRFVYPNISAILFGQGEEIWEQQVIPYLDDFLLPVFESVCAEYLERLADSKETPFTYRHTGSWWCGGTKREPYFRIPLVALDGSHAVLGQCHCSDEPAGIRCLEDLQRPLEPFDGMTRYYCIFSTSGFTEELRDASSVSDNVWLIDLEDIAG